VKYQVQLVWNREFDWCNYSNSVDDFDKAIKIAEDIRNSGDGAIVKKVRVVDAETEKVLWDGYKKLI
jgi:hypothetical protein